MAKRRKWSATQKFEIALQAVRGEKTLNEICKRYMVSPTQVNEWKKHCLSEVPSYLQNLVGQPKKLMILKIRSDCYMKRLVS
jgi:transposase-like protein